MLTCGALLGIVNKPLKKKNQALPRENSSNISFSGSNGAPSSSSHQSTPTSVLRTYSLTTAPGKGSSVGFHSTSESHVILNELELVLSRLNPTLNSTNEFVSTGPELDFEEGGLLDLMALGADSADLAEAFAIFDADGDGRISAEELMGVFVSLGEEICTLEDCRCMIGAVDTDGDGYVCFDDFARMMSGHK